MKYEKDGKEWGLSFDEDTLVDALTMASAQLNWYLSKGHTVVDLPVFSKVSTGYRCTMSLRKPLATS